MTHAERENLIFKHRVLGLLEIKSIYEFSSRLNEIKKKKRVLFRFHSAVWSFLLYLLKWCFNNITSKPGWHLWARHCWSSGQLSVEAQCVEQVMYCQKRDCRISSIRSPFAEPEGCRKHSWRDILGKHWPGWRVCVSSRCSNAWLLLSELFCACPKPGEILSVVIISILSYWLMEEGMSWNHLTRKHCNNSAVVILLMMTRNLFFLLRVNAGFVLMRETQAAPSSRANPAQPCHCLMKPSSVFGSWNFFHQANISPSQASHHLNMGSKWIRSREEMLFPAPRSR